MAKKLFVGGLTPATTDAQLGDHFSKVGQVVSAKVITDKYSGQGRGFGFVEMNSEEEAAKAMQELEGSELNGKRLTVKEARPQAN